jgi:hypothetical protein
MKIIKKYADLKTRDKRNTSNICFIVIQSFNNKDTGHYHIVDGGLYQMLPDDYISNSVNGCKYNKLGIYHGICTKYNSISIGIADNPEESDIELCRHLIITIRQRYGIKEENVIRQTDVTGDISPEIWFDKNRWDKEIIQGIKDILDN